MAYTALSTLSDGDVLSASHMNAIGSNIADLDARISAVNIPFPRVSIDRDWDDRNARWGMIHRVQYLHYKARLVDSDADLFTVWVNGVSGFSDATVRNNPYTYQGYIDLSSGYSLTVGDPYEIYIEATFSSAAPRLIYVDWFRESAGTTL